MATQDIEAVLHDYRPTTPFRPYVTHNKESDSLTFYFRPDGDYAKRLTDHVTLFLSQQTDEVVGCRLKGVAAILEDLPNYVRVAHEGFELSVMFLPFRSQVTTQEERTVLNRLAQAAAGIKLELA